MQPNHELVDYLGYCQLLVCMAVSFMLLQSVALTSPLRAPAKPRK